MKPIENELLWFRAYVTELAKVPCSGRGSKERRFESCRTHFFSLRWDEQSPKLILKWFRQFRTTDGLYIYLLLDEVMFVDDDER